GCENLDVCNVDVHFEEILDMGEIESISQIKPKAPNKHEYVLLEFLEDIIGTKSLEEANEKA
ncbi:8239_t:CDS:2, partial [Funneliformis geosporum]